MPADIHGRAAEAAQLVCHKVKGRFGDTAPQVWNPIFFSHHVIACHNFAHDTVIGVDGSRPVQAALHTFCRQRRVQSWHDLVDNGFIGISDVFVIFLRLKARYLWMLHIAVAVVGHKGF